MIIRYFFFLFLVIVAISFGCVSEQTKLKTGPTRTLYYVSEVISGDTIFLEGVGRVRYIGVSAPKQSLSGKHDEPFSAECKRENERLLAGKWCRYELDKEEVERDKTTLAYVFARADGEEILVNAHLLEQGLARFSPSTVNTKYYERLLSAESTAKRNKRGMWARTSAE